MEPRRLFSARLQTATEGVERRLAGPWAGFSGLSLTQPTAFAENAASHSASDSEMYSDGDQQHWQTDIPA